MIRLAIETATHACSVALQADGEIRQRFEVAPRRHGELILPWVDELLAEGGYRRNQLQGIALSRGPGSFTSLRLGLSAGAAIAFALDIPVYPVSTLAALAWAGYRRHDCSQLIAALDARMDEIYVAAYRVSAGQLQPLHDEQLIAPAHYAAPEQPLGTVWAGVGNGFSALDCVLQTTLGARLKITDSDCWPDAAAVLELASSVEPQPAEQFQPVYLRERVAEPARPRRA